MIKNNLDKVLNISEIDQFAKSLSPKQFNIFLRLLNNKFTNKDIDDLQKSYLLKNFDIKANVKPNELFIIEKNLKEIERLLKIISNEGLINKIGGLKILFSGSTGTGKTTIINYLIDNSKNIDYKYINFEGLVSSKMGQTQINLIQLGHELCESKGRKIIFIDEMDSLINSRDTSDLGEHSRIVATFLKFLDMLKDSIVVIGATNYVDKIDSAVVRRFNIKVPTVGLSFNEFIESLKYEGLEISNERIKFLSECLKDNKEFTIGHSKNVIDEWMIKNELGEEANVSKIIVELNKDYFEID